MTTTIKRPLKTPKPCRYCGHVAQDHVREETSQRTRPLYSCQSVEQCGERLRKQRPAGWKDDGLPF